MAAAVATPVAATVAGDGDEEKSDAEPSETHLREKYGIKEDLAMVTKKKCMNMKW